ncbi:DsbA family protein [Corynebacterium sp. USCH3]|uniref:DsbA family oxidoreductase n=1 Tax=Corynebacterium sp. USCH3 TaxID=3024840 RepID=UPI0030B3E395
MPASIEVYLDYVCPFCFLVEPALDELKRDRDVEVTIRPFELRPHPVPTLRPEDDYLPRVWEASVYPMSERVGVPVTLPTVSPQPRTEKAFLVLQLAQEQGRAENYTEAMFTAFFREDRDIGVEDTIIDIATSVGLDRAEVVAALHSDDRRTQHRESLDHAVNTIGVQAVPAIAVDGVLLRGVPGAARLRKAVDQARQGSGV